MEELDLSIVRPIVEKALEEDIGSGDITTLRTIPPDIEEVGIFIIKQDGIICGSPIVKLVYEILDKDIQIEFFVKEGSKAPKYTEIARITGLARSILIGERVALNFLTYLSGISTYTNLFVEKARPYGVTILDTRKTIPGLRYLEKYAVRMGGGGNHRMGLYDKILIKDNHLKVLSKLGPDFIHRAIKGAKGKDNREVEIEVQNLDETKQAYESGAEILLLDNIDLDELKKIVEIYKGKVLLEVSGGVTLENIEEIAQTGVDYISIGSITHSAPAVDISLEIVSE